MSLSVNKGYNLQSTGSGSGTWGATLNTDVFTIIDNNVGGIATITVGSSPVTLSSTEAQQGIVRFVGTLTADVTVTTSCIGFFYVENATAGAYTITMQFTGGVGSTVKPMQSMTTPVISDSTNGLRYGVSSLPPGTIIDYAGTLNSKWTGEYLLCDGSAVSRTTYSALFAAIQTTWGAGNGSTTFNVPDLRGRVTAGRDDMGGSAASRITQAVSGVDGTLVGGVGASQSVTLTNAMLPANIPNSASSSASTSITGGATIGGGTSSNLTTGSGGATNNAVLNGSAILATTTVSTTVTINAASGGTAVTPVVQPTAIVNKLIKL